MRSALGPFAGNRNRSTQYVLPVADGGRAAWSPTHSTYPATDIFVGCGATLVSPVWGEELEVRRVDSHDPAVDDRATRGGRSVAILGFDGVRYYLAHFESIVEDLAVGGVVEAGRVLGTMGDSGRTSACHLHFSISPSCPNDGVVGPPRRDLAVPATSTPGERASRRAARPGRRGHGLGGGEPRRLHRARHPPLTVPSG